jgi:bifunctional DNase/RNase
MKKVEIERVAFNLLTNSPIIILKEAGGRVLPIAVRIFEAQSILMVLEKTPFSRPLTHDLIKNLIETFSVTLLKLEIHSIKRSVYYAHLVFSQSGVIKTIDCRPSDGIAIALRFKVDIFVADKLLKDKDIIEYGKGLKLSKRKKKNDPIDRKEAEKLKGMIDNMSAKEFWKEIKDE